MAHPYFFLFEVLFFLFDTEAKQKYELKIKILFLSSLKNKQKTKQSLHVRPNERWLSCDANIKN